MKDKISEEQIKKIMNKYVLTDEDLEILAKYEKSKFRRVG
jgi:hypothetical protein